MNLEPYNIVAVGELWIQYESISEDCANVNLVTSPFDAQSFDSVEEAQESSDITHGEIYVLKATVSPA